MKTKLFSALAVALLITAAANAQTTTWNLTGNAGTSPSTNFVGTTDTSDLVFKAHNQFAGILNKSKENTAFGILSFNSNTSGVNNTAIGYSALNENTDGKNNTALGFMALSNTISGSQNVGIGAYSLANATGSGNIGMGVNSALHAIGLSNTVVIGNNAMVYATGGNNNTVLGDIALGNLTSGNNNIAIGYSAGESLASTGSNNIFIVSNYSAPLITTDVSNQLNIGNWIYGNNGNIGIGTNGNTHSAKLAVNGTILAQAVTIDTNPADWPDYVFTPNYNLPVLADVKVYLDKNKHLPEMPSAEEIGKDGLKLGLVTKVLTQKVEELTLYMIDKDKEVKDLNSKIAVQQGQIEKLTKLVEELAKKNSK